MAEIKRYQPDVVYARYGGGRDHVLHEHTNGDYVLHSDHLGAIKAAVEEERQACWQAIEDIDDGEAPEYRACQEAIRARGAAHECKHPNAKCVYDSDDGEYEKWECPDCRKRWGVEIPQ